VTFTSPGTIASVEINDSNAFDLKTLTTTGNLTVIAGGNITDSGTVTVGGNLSATTNANNGVIDLGTLAVDGTIALATHGTGAAIVSMMQLLNLPLPPLVEHSVQRRLPETSRKAVHSLSLESQRLQRTVVIT